MLDRTPGGSYEPVDGRRGAFSTAARSLMARSRRRVRRGCWLGCVAHMLLCAALVWRGLVVRIRKFLTALVFEDEEAGRAIRIEW